MQCPRRSGEGLSRQTNSRAYSRQIRQFATVTGAPTVSREIRQASAARHGGTGGGSLPQEFERCVRSRPRKDRSRSISG